MSSIPTCADCSHLVGRRPNTWEATTWKCGLSKTGEDIVSGSPLYALLCYAAREAGQPCGPTGAQFQRYTQPSYSLPAGKRAGPTKTADDLLGELDI